MSDDPLQPSPTTANFPPNSRYHGVGTATHELPGGRQVVYLQRRFLPRTDGFQIVLEHTVTSSDRLDLIAAEHLGDPLLFWRLCDANGAMHPDELLKQERVLITLPEGIQGEAL
jgi:hypothetical protein